MNVASKRCVSKQLEIQGGDACIHGTRIPVWVLVNYRRLGGDDVGLLRDYPSLTAADLEVAWEYAAKNPEEIDSAIQANENEQDRTTLASGGMDNVAYLWKCNF